MTAQGPERVPDVLRLAVESHASLGEFNTKLGGNDEAVSLALYDAACLSININSAGCLPHRSRVNQPSPEWTLVHCS